MAKLSIGCGVGLAALAVLSLWWIIGFADYCAISCGTLFCHVEPPQLIDFSISSVNAACPWRERLWALFGWPRVEFENTALAYVELPLWVLSSWLR